MTELATAPERVAPAGTDILPLRRGAVAGLWKITLAEIAAFVGGGGSSNPWWFSPPLAAAMTTRTGDATSPTITDDANVGLILDFGPAVGGDISRIATLTVPAPSADWTVDMQISNLNPADNFNASGMFLRNAATGKLYDFARAQDGITTITRRPSLAGWTADTYQKNWGLIQFYKIVFTAGTGTYDFYVSNNGKQWILVLSQTVAAHFGAGNFADQVGFGCVTSFASATHLGATCGRLNHSW